LRGLAALVARIDALLGAHNQPEHDFDGLDLFGLSRFLHRRGDPDGAHAACSQALDRGLPAEFHPQACQSLALLAKRRGDYQTAVLLWQKLVANPSDCAQEAIHACEQLAIFFEHRARDYARASEFARLALAKMRRTRTGSRTPYGDLRSARLEQRLLNRIARLEHRITLDSGTLVSAPLPRAPRRLGHSTSKPAL